MKKQIISMLLAVIMLLSLMPMTALALKGGNGREPYRIYDVEIGTDSIKFKIDRHEYNPEDGSREYLECYRIDAMLQAASSIENPDFSYEKEPDSYSKYNLSLNPDGGSEGTSLIWDGNTAICEIKPALTKGVSGLCEERPYVFLSISPCCYWIYMASAYSGYYLDDMTEEEAKAYFNTDNYIGEFGSNENWLNCTTDHAHKTGDDTIHFSPWDGGSEHNSMPTEAGNYFLTSDITLTQQWKPAAGVTNLCLNGHVLYLAASGNNNISLEGGRTLNIYDCDSATEHYFHCTNGAMMYDSTPAPDAINGAVTLDQVTDSTEYVKIPGGAICGGTNIVGGAIFLNNAGNTVNLYGGNIVGNKIEVASQYQDNLGYRGDGGAVYVDQNSTFNMYGGVIAGNTALRNGGAVFLRPGAYFSMYGGLISHNYAPVSGGAVAVGPYNNNGSETSMRSFNMYGGAITCNTADSDGGGVYVYDGISSIYSDSIISNNRSKNNGAGVCVENAYFNMYDNSVIIGNTASNSGGGIRVGKDGFLCLEGNSKISGNEAKTAGGVMFSGSEFLMTSGSIDNNTSTENGGGVAFSGSEFIMTGGSINHNAAVNCGGVQITKGDFTMTGGSIDSNTSTNYGGLLAYGNVTLGGEANITGNVDGGEIKDGELSGGTPDNVYLANNKYLTLGDGIPEEQGGNGVAVPTGDFSVGVTTQNAPVSGSPVKITVNGTSADTQYFTSDNIDYEVGYNANGYLELKVPHVHNLVKVTGQAATELAAGFKDYYECKDSVEACGDLFEDENGATPIDNLDTWKAVGGNGYIAPLIHNPEPVNGKDATDTEPGYKPYYACKNCGRYYEDADGTVEIANVDAWKAEGGNGYIAPLHGIDNDHDHMCDACGDKVSDCIDANNDHLCDICGDKISDCADNNNDHLCDTCGDKISDCADNDNDHLCDTCGDKISDCADNDNDHLCDTCGKKISDCSAVLVKGIESTKDSAGHKSYYKCDCGKFYEDEDCKIEITDLEKWMAKGGAGYIEKLDKNQVSPQTGDNSQIALWLMLLAFSSVGVAVCIILKKKSRNEQ